ncbi:MAG TPA: FkbM family methyltransferase [Puia sp.]|nr:FkbM family methyltransferase [Puia sp.]
MKEKIKKVLAKLGLLENIRYHQLYRIYRSSVYRKAYYGLFNFFNQLLGKKNKLIFDVGANVGDYTRIFSKLSNKVLAIEPDEQNNFVLHKRFSGNKKITIVPKALAASTGEAKFFIQAYGSGFNTLSSKWVTILGDKDHSRFGSIEFTGSKEVETTTLDHLISQHGKPDFIKIDVEGFEWEVIKGLTQPVQLISFECNLPEFLEESISIVGYLHKIDSKYRFNYIEEYCFLLPEFIEAEAMIAKLKESSIRYIDIFCKLS